MTFVWIFIFFFVDNHSCALISNAPPFFFYSSELLLILFSVKPFNPLLGETFEYLDDEKNLRFVAEQVSHHPPIGASHCETPHFIYYQSQSVKTKFLGNSLDVTPIGVSSVILKKWGEHYSWPNVRTIVHRLIIGKMWVDHFGDTTITIKKDGTDEVLPVKVDIKYKQCGWFGRGWSDVEGKVLVPEGEDKFTPVFSISGKWTESLSATATPLGKHLTDGKVSFTDEKPQLLWKHEAKLCTEKRWAKYDWTEFTLKLCDIDDEMRKSLPPSDARIREDRVWLQKADTKKASRAKNILEEAQRTRRKTLEEDKAEYKPKYFDLQTTTDGKEVYMFNGKYWAERLQRTEQNNANGTFTTDEDANKYWRLSAHHKEVSE